MTKKPKTKKLWFIAENIPKINYFVMLPVFAEYGRFIARQGGGNYFNKVMWIFRNGDAELCYPRQNFNKGINFLLNKVINNPAWAQNLNQQLFEYAKAYFSFAKKLENKDFSKFFDLELFKVFWRLTMIFQKRSHNSGQTTTWLIDAEKNLFSNYLLDLLKEKIKSQQLKLDFSEIFSILTTPEQPGFLELESQEALKIAVLLNQDKTAKNIILKNRISEIAKKLKKTRPRLEKLMRRHWQKYLWLYYTYQGPVLEYEYFLEIWQGILKLGKIRELLEESRRHFIRIKKQRTDLFKRLKFSPKEKRLFEIAKDIVWLKAYRKDCMYFGSYVCDKISKEMAKRLGLSLRQVRYFAYWEVKNALLKNKFNLDVLNERYKFSVVYSNSKKCRLYSGKEAEKFLKTLNFEKQILKEINELKGMTAYPGIAKGIVKIVNSVDDLAKMNKGDILLSETTYPALVPAMKKAGAIVTNVGGLTCHAAIVSRELKIPCVVGTKIATKVLRDGDLVEVDATKGVVRKVR